MIASDIQSFNPAETSEDDDPVLHLDEVLVAEDEQDDREAGSSVSDGLVRVAKSYTPSHPQDFRILKTFAAFDVLRRSQDSARRFA